MLIQTAAGIVHQMQWHTYDSCVGFYGTTACRQAWSTALGFPYAYHSPILSYAHILTSPSPLTCLDCLAQDPPC